LSTVAGVMPKRAAVARSITRSVASALLLQVARDVGELRQLARSFCTSFGTQVLNSVLFGVLEHELVLRAADRGVDRQVLHRLHVERDAGDVAVLLLQPRMISLASAALVVRLQVDQEAAAVERRVGAVDADEGAQARRRDP
jgi:hypothetical protein